jgi:hypothetical protein
MFKSLLVLGSLTLCFGVLAPAYADIVYENLSNPPGSILGTFPIGNPTPTGGGGAGPEGDSFSTGASQLLITSVVLKLRGVHDSDSFNLSLFSDNDTMCVPGPSCSGGPLSLLYTIATVSDNSLSTTSLANYAFPLASPQTLAANTRYWIMASSTNGSRTLWSYTEDLSGVGVAGEFNDDAFSLGPNSNEKGCLVGPSKANVCTPFQMEIIATPEPNGLGILSIGLAGLAGLIRRRKHSRKSMAT